MGGGVCGQSQFMNSKYSPSKSLSSLGLTVKRNHKPHRAQAADDSVLRNTAAAPRTILDATRSSQQVPTPMNRIRLLPEQVANQIAAGEVIERPASIVKELVENSLDAQANRITVEIQAGGRSLVRVTDDGLGMSRDDALLCLERHATSKIQRAEDLSAIATMGFRGEALPSIASVSRFTLTTRERENPSPEGTQVVVNGGKIIEVKAAGTATGTSGSQPMSRRRKPASPPASSASAITARTTSGSGSTMPPGSFGTWLNGDTSITHCGSCRIGPSWPISTTAASSTPTPAGRIAVSPNNTTGRNDRMGTDCSTSRIGSKMRSLAGLLAAA